MPGETNCACLTPATNTFIFNSSQAQLAANSVYQYKTKFDTSGKTYQFKSDWERMQYLLGKKAVVCNPPYVLITDIFLNALTSASTNLSAMWTITNKSRNTNYTMNITYYSTTSAVVPLTGGTQVGTIQLVASGKNTNTLSPAVQPVSGTYYFLGVQPLGGDEIRSAVAIRMP